MLAQTEGIAVVGKPWHSPWGLVSVAPLNSEFERCRDQLLPTQMSITTFDGENPRTVALLLIPLHDASGQFTNMLINVASSTVESESLYIDRLQTEFAQASRLATIGEMTVGIAHEINQPLSAIALYAQAAINMLSRPDFDSAKVSSALFKLREQALRAGAVIERTQLFAKDRGGERETLDINNLILDLMHLAQADARAHDLVIELELADSLHLVRADPLQLQQVVLNLIRNAIDATVARYTENPQNIKIWTRINSDTQQVAVGVEDAGIGITEKQEELMFTTFYTTKSDGLGMGLSICRTIVESHGGRLRCQRNPEQGVTFLFSLPAEFET